MQAPHTSYMMFHAALPTRRFLKTGTDSWLSVSLWASSFRFDQGRGGCRVNGGGLRGWRGPYTQTFQSPVIKEYALKHTLDPTIT